jgi:hypothetical protein
MEIWNNFILKMILFIKNFPINFLVFYLSILFSLNKNLLKMVNEYHHPI